nr:ABC transporter permease [Galbitalea soli]
MLSTHPRIRRAIGNQEVLLLVIALVIVGAVSVRNPGFLGVDTLFNILTSALVPFIFGIGVTLVLIAGGIDVSFLTVGIFAAYLSCRLFPQADGAPGALLSIAVAVGVGVLLGLVNAVVVLGARLSTLIATLATSAIFLGALFAFIGGTVISDIPHGLVGMNSVSLVRIPLANGGTTRLSALVIIGVVLAVLVALFLRRTIAGRWVFAVGGDEEAARRVGIPIRATRVLVFAIAGGIAGLAGIVQVAQSGRADPTTFIGGELNVIAAVVLGGALITGGRGRVRGTLLGVIVIQIINSALIPLGIPAIWQQAVIGLLLILGVSLQTIANRVRPIRAILAPPASSVPIGETV